MPEPIVIADYDARWPELFEVIRDRVAGVLGSLAVAIEHVGSTSVPGLAAKPVIDLDIAVARQHDMAEGIRLLATIGYGHQGDLGIAGREAFSVPPGDIRHHPYLVTVDGREFRRHLAFRDRMRTDGDVRSEYEMLKRRLAREFGSDVTGYSISKSEFVERILAEEFGAEHHG